MGHVQGLASRAAFIVDLEEAPAADVRTAGIPSAVRELDKGGAVRGRREPGPLAEENAWAAGAAERLANGRDGAVSSLQERGGAKRQRRRRGRAGRSPHREHGSRTRQSGRIEAEQRRSIRLRDGGAVPDEKRREEARRRVARQDGCIARLDERAGERQRRCRKAV